MLRTLSLLSGMVFWACLPCAARAQQGALALTGANVIDVRTGEVLPSRTVVIADGRITSVHPDGSNSVPAGSRVVDTNGAYLLPGLWDMHVHLAYGEQLSRGVFYPLSLMAGVTGVREMAGDTVTLRLRDAIERGEVLGPRLHVGAFLDDPRGGQAGSAFQEPATEPEGREAVARAADLGFDFVKTYSHLTFDTYRAVAETARQLGVPLEGHVPIEVPLEEALALGHRTVEHLVGMEFGCSEREGELRGEYTLALQSMEDPASAWMPMQLFGRSEWEPFAAVDPTECEQVDAKVAASGAWVVPTLIRQELVSYRFDAPILGDPSARLLVGLLDPEDVWGAVDPDRQLLPLYEHRLSRMEELHDAGIPILAGSDLPGGIPLHYELALLVDGGLTPLEAIQSATLSPARYLEREDDMGAVEPGKVADVILLRSNPLEDITRTRDIVGVVRGGTYLGPEELATMGANVRAILESLLR